NFGGEVVAAGTGADHESLDDLSAQGIGYANDGRFLDIGVFEQGVFDFHRAHGPACRNNDVVCAPGMIEVAVFVDAAQVFGGHPFIAAHDFHFAHDVGRARPALGVLYFDDAARYGFAQRAVLDREVGGAGVGHQDHTDFGGAVHAADGGVEQGLDEGFC